MRDLFPDGGDLAQARFWAGFRPMTPDSTPIVGGTRYVNLYTNMGHETLGWIMAFRSGRLLAEVISGRATDIPHQELSQHRYASRA